MKPKEFTYTSDEGPRITELAKDILFVAVGLISNQDFSKERKVKPCRGKAEIKRKLTPEPQFFYS